MSSGGSISIDRRDAYYERLAAAKLISKDPLGFYTRAEAGRRVQAGVKRDDYVTPKPVPEMVFTANVSPITKAARHA